MNIQCEQCNTHYQISDEKVRGRDRVFKIPCKNCGAIMTFNGLPEPQSNTPAEDSDPAVWFYVSDGQQVGPLTKLKLRVARAKGLVAASTFVWRSGMQDWVPLESVPELASLLAEPALLEEDASTEIASDNTPTDTSAPDTTVAASSAQTGSSDTQPTVTQPADSPGPDARDQRPQFDEAPELASQKNAGTADSRPPADDDLFTPRDAADDAAQDQSPPLDSLFVDNTPAAESPAQSRAADNDGMVWQRGDNSVLFSLNETDEPAPAPRIATSRQDAFASLPQDSGLIDIRSFSKKKKEKAAASGDLFANLAGEDSQGGSSASPILSASTTASIPVIQRKRRGNGVLYAAVLFGVVALAAVGALVYMLVLKSPEPTPMAAIPAAAQPVAAVPAAAQPVAAQPAEAPLAAAQPAEAPLAAAQPAETQPAATQPAETQPAAAQPAPAEVKPKEPKRPLTAAERRKLAVRRERYRKAREEKAKAVAASKAAKAASKAAAAKAAEAKKNPPKVDPNALLKKMGAPPSKPNKPSASQAGAGGAELPSQPTNSQVKKTMRSANSRIRSCVKGAGEAGKVIVSFRIAPGGRASGASVSGTSAGGCIKGVVSGLRFPKSKQGRSVRFPYTIK